MPVVKITSIFLGMISPSFGVLEFVYPLKEWDAKQIITSGLPFAAAYAVGLVGEIILIIVSLFLFIAGLNDKRKGHRLDFANISLCIMMGSATLVHLMPNVPASVLPLKIPGSSYVVLFVAIFNLPQINKMSQL